MRPYCLGRGLRAFLKTVRASHLLAYQRAQGLVWTLFEGMTSGPRVARG